MEKIEKREKIGIKRGEEMERSLGEASQDSNSDIRAQGSLTGPRTQAVDPPARALPLYLAVPVLASPPTEEL